MGCVRRGVSPRSGSIAEIDSRSSRRSIREGSRGDGPDVSPGVPAGRRPSRLSRRPADRRPAPARGVEGILISRTLVTFVLACIASVVALNHFDNIPAYLTLAPGYLVQSWLFERHWALGGLGYQATMVGVSAVFWAGILLGFLAAARTLHRWLRRLRSD